MPQFTYRDGRYCGSYITGPKHIWLGLRFGTSQELQVIRLPAIGGRLHEVIDEVRLVEAIQAGVCEAEKEAGAHLAVEEVAYVENDTPSYALYQTCGKQIALRFLNGEGFAAAPRSPI